MMAVGLASSMVYSSTPRRLVSVDEAKDLVAAALPLTTRHLPKFGVDGQDDPEFPQFYFLSAMWAGAPDGSAVIGHYYVDKSTGDVWSATAECEQESTPELRKLQGKIRLRIGLSGSEYHKIKRKGPFCS
jgi:hypothetical protein